MVPLTYDNIDLNTTVQGISDLRRDHRRNIDAVVADSSGILNDTTLAEIEQMVKRRVHVYIIKGVKEEVEARLKYNGLGGKTEQAKERVKELLREIEEQGRVLDIKTRGATGHTLLEIENHSILDTLSDGQSKAVVEMLLLDRYPILFRDLVVIHKAYKKRNRYYHLEAARTISERRDVSAVSLGARDAYISLQNRVKEIEKDLFLGALEQQLKHIAGELLGSFDYLSYLQAEQEGIRRDRTAIVRALVDKLVPTTLVRIGQRKTMEQARAEYLRENKNKSPTDRKIVLAAYATLPLRGYNPRNVGIITRDRDLHELLVLRQYTTVDYKQYLERRKK